LKQIFDFGVATNVFPSLKQNDACMKVNMKAWKASLIETSMYNDIVWHKNINPKDINVKT
jgi:hypothetical protein